MPIETLIFSIVLGSLGAIAILHEWFHDAAEEVDIPRSDIIGPWLDWWDRNV